MTDITDTIIFNRSISASASGTLEHPIPYDCHVTNVWYFFARNQQNFLHVDVKVGGVSVASYEKDGNKYVMGDGFVVHAPCWREAKVGQKLECEYENADADDAKTLFVIVHILRKLAKDEIKEIVPFKWWW